MNVHGPAFDTLQWDRIAWFGLGWVRGDVPWWAVHRAPGVFEWSRFDGMVLGAKERGLEVLALLEGTPPWVVGLEGVGGWAASAVPPAGPWEEFVTEAVRRYRPGGVLAQQQGWPEGVGVRYWEVGNEPDLRTFWKGTATDYRDRIWLPAIRIIRREDPQAKILFAGLCCFDPGGDDPWALGGSTAQVLDTEESRQGVDIFSLHYYPRSVDKTVLQDPWVEMLRVMSGAQEFLDRLYGPGHQIPLWLTETGFALSTFGSENQALGIRRLVGRVLLSQDNRLVNPENGRFLLQKFFIFNTISADFGMFELDPLYRPTVGGRGYRRAIGDAIGFLGLQSTTAQRF